MASVSLYYKDNVIYKLTGIYLVIVLKPQEIIIILSGKYLSIKIILYTFFLWYFPYTTLLKTLV